MSDEALNAHLDWLDDCAGEQSVDYEALLEKRTAELQAENDVLRNTVSLLKNENERLTDGVEELEAENDKLKRATERMSAKMAYDCANSVMCHQHDRCAYDHEIAEVQKEIDALQAYANILEEDDETE